MALMTRVGECSVKGNIPALKEIRKQKAASMGSEKLKGVFNKTVADQATPTYKLRMQAYKAKKDASVFAPLSSLWNTVKAHKVVAAAIAALAVIGVTVLSVKKVLDNKKD